MYRELIVCLGKGLYKKHIETPVARETLNVTEG